MTGEGRRWGDRRVKEEGDGERGKEGRCEERIAGGRRWGDRRVKEREKGRKAREGRWRGQEDKEGKENGEKESKEKRGCQGR